jgi:hypothetical protein
MANLQIAFEQDCVNQLKRGLMPFEFVDRQNILRLAFLVVQVMEADWLGMLVPLLKYG